MLDLDNDGAGLWIFAVSAAIAFAGLLLFVGKAGAWS
jgi:hypothetical protein